MIERKCEKIRPLQYLLRSLVNMMLAVKPRIREITERDIDAVADLRLRCAGKIGRYLLWCCKPVVIIDANGPVAGLRGFYSETHGRYTVGSPTGRANARPLINSA